MCSENAENSDQVSVCNNTHSNPAEQPCCIVEIVAKFNSSSDCSSFHETKMIYTVVGAAADTNLLILRIDHL